MTAASTQLTAGPLLFYALGLLAFSLEIVVIQFFFARQDTLTPVLTDVAAFALNVALIPPLMAVFGLGGIALATTVAKTLKVLVLLFLFGRRLPAFRLASLAPFAGQVALASLATAIVLLAFRPLEMGLAAGNGLAGQAAYSRRRGAAGRRNVPARRLSPAGERNPRSGRLAQGAAARCFQAGNLTFGGSEGIVGSVTEDRTRPLGDWLREQREALEIGLEQVEEETRIRVRYLQALESDEFEALPDPVVGRGFLRNYAAYLGLDPQEASDRFSNKVAPPQPESLAVEGPTPFSIDPFRPVDLHEMPGQRGPRLWAVGLAVILIAALAVLAWWSYPRIQPLLVRAQPTATQTRAATPTQGADVTLPTATRTPTLPPATTESPPTEAPSRATPTTEPTRPPTLTPSLTPTPSPVIYTGIFLELVFTDISWIQVSVDGVRQFQGELEAETYKSWYGEERIELRIGNAGAVMVTVNGQNLGTLGAPGEVVDRIFEKVGEEVSGNTPTPQPNGTETVEPTAPLPTESPLPETATPTPGATGTVPAETATIAPTEPITPTATP